MPLPATHELHIFGSINSLEFDLVGRGTGNPKEGYEELHLKSTKSALQFSPWILVPQIGYQVHRTMQFEDGATLTGIYRYTYEGTHIKGEFQVIGTGFPADGPVMTNSLTAADWCVTKMVYPNENTIIDKFDWTYTTTSGKRYQSNVRSNFTFAKPIAANILQKQPMFVFRKTELKHSKTELKFKEWQKAFSDVM
ncbi:Hypp2223 [Branchiostoma lanceolatum]|uniref:Hypp2223 protein n=1 Tax=Branchiostoma lanceolatum TaxID=7740 RepID=A0A8K0ERU6_BRALA|nr:Hypp2223 [Branchiostoma lanceolatum]